MKIKLLFDKKKFKKILVKELRNVQHVELHPLIAKALTSSLSSLLETFILEDRIVSYKWNAYPYPNRGIQCLSDLVEKKLDYDIWYLKLILISKTPVVSSQNEVATPEGLRWLPFVYGPGNKQYIKLKETKQKTQLKTEIEFLHLKIDHKIFQKIYSLISKNCECERKFLNPILSGVWDWRLTYTCQKCGKCYVCSCFKRALKKVPLEDHQGPHRSERARFKNKICHICTKTPSDLFYCSPMYGSDIKVKYGCYIKKLQIESGTVERDAENQIRMQIGVPKIGEGWINETLLYNSIKVLFPNLKLIREASPDWLNRMRLDIYIPEHFLAIEYQGEQHFRAISRFGGDEAFEKTKLRDKEKKKLCEKNGIKLIYFNFDEEITEKIIIQKLKRYIK